MKKESITIKQNKIMIHNISRYLLTLALLLTAVTGAWAQDIATPVISGETEFYDEVTVTITCASSGVDIYYTLDGSDPRGDHPAQIDYNKAFTLTETTTVKAAAYSGSWSAIVEVTFTKQTGPKVTWDAATKTGTFTMSSSDVELTPIYAPAAAFNLSDGSNDKLPAAVEGIFIGSTNAIITEGACAQGSLMYAVSTSATEAPSEFSSVVPTAENILTPGTYYVWYFIAGADTPQGQTPTAENTFNDSEICTTPIEVNIISDKFDIQFNAANANTIEDGKATVTVDGQSATLTDGKLTGVKMDSKVTITAKEGYKFRKVEATKGISTLKSVKIGNYTVYYAEGETWYQAFWRDENNNCGLETSVGRVFTYNDKSLRDSDGDVYADAVIDPSKGYYIAD